MFRGRYEHTIDGKGRVSVPARFRDNLKEQGHEQLIITHFGDCLVGYSLAEWEALERQIASLPQMKSEVKAFQRYFLSGATECPLDKQGRVLLPSFLRDYAQIDKDVVFLGMLKKVEIWSKERWANAFERAQEKFEENADALSELGL